MHFSQTIELWWDVMCVVTFLLDFEILLMISWHYTVLSALSLEIGGHSWTWTTNCKWNYFALATRCTVLKHFFTQATDYKVSSICMFWSIIDYLHVQYNNVFTRQIVDTISLNSTFNQFWSSKTFPYHCWNKMCSWRKLTTEASLYVFFSSTVCEYNISEKAALRSVFKYTSHITPIYSKITYFSVVDLVYLFVFVHAIQL